MPRVFQQRKGKLRRAFLLNETFVWLPRGIEKGMETEHKVKTAKGKRQTYYL